MHKYHSNGPNQDIRRSCINLDNLRDEVGRQADDGNQRAELKGARDLECCSEGMHFVPIRDLKGACWLLSTCGCKASLYTRIPSRHTHTAIPV